MIEILIFLLAGGFSGFMIEKTNVFAHCEKTKHKDDICKQFSKEKK